MLLLLLFHLIYQYILFFYICNYNYIQILLLALFLYHPILYITCLLFLYTFRSLKLSTFSYDNLLSHISAYNLNQASTYIYLETSKLLYPFRVNLTIPFLYPLLPFFFSIWHTLFVHLNPYYVSYTLNKTQGVFLYCLIFRHF